MELEVVRFSSQKDSTNGLLFKRTSKGHQFLCYTLEDEHRDEKVSGETRVPAGRYMLTLRTVGGFHSRYKKKFPDIHKGMLWVTEVPGFEYILIHIGNTDEDTAGCLLVGDTQKVNFGDSDGFIGSSVPAYKRIYPEIAEAISSGEEVWITYKDIA
jgi:hypothetical protein